MEAGARHSLSVFLSLYKLTYQIKLNQYFFKNKNITTGSQIDTDPSWTLLFKSLLFYSIKLVFTLPHSYSFNDTTKHFFFLRTSMKPNGVCLWLAWMKMRLVQHDLLLET